MNNKQVNRRLFRHYQASWAVNLLSWQTMIRVNVALREANHYSSIVTARRVTRRTLLAITGMLLSWVHATQTNTATGAQPVADKQVNLPRPISFGGLSINEALQERRSLRRYRNGKLTLGEVSQLLWAAQGLSSREGYRTAPSAGALYGLEIHLTVGNVAELDAGVYRYLPIDHQCAPSSPPMRNCSLRSSDRSSLRIVSAFRMAMAAVKASITASNLTSTASPTATMVLDAGGDEVEVVA